MSDIELAKARMEMYSFIARGFSYPPSIDLLQRLMGEDARRELGRFLDMDIETILPASENISEEMSKALRNEFFSLFKVPGDRYLRPYESVFVDKSEIMGGVNGILIGESCGKVKKMYDDAGYIPPVDMMELPDYIGCELGFMSYLTSQEREALVKGDSVFAKILRPMQENFLAEHLNRWLHLLVEEAVKKEAHPFYGLLFSMAERLVAMDLEGFLPD